MLTVEEAIYKRRSIRYFKDDPLTPEEVEKLMNAGRKTPSAGARRPLKLLAIEQAEVKNKLMAAAIGQKSVGSAPLVIVIAADYPKIVAKYRNRGYRYAMLEAGHAGQNIALMAVSMGLGSVMIGAFSDNMVKAILEIQEDPLYLIPVGRLIDAV